MVVERPPARTPVAQPQHANGLARYLPILGWLPSYKAEWLRSDLIAGLTVVAVLVPEGMAYAQLAGMPPQTAFYIAPVALVLYAIFGTSRQLIVCVSATVSVTSAATVSPHAAQGSAQFMAFTAMLAILAGAVSVLFGILKLGRLARFFSESVLTGFVFGLALVIAIKQVPKIFGIDAGGEDFFVRLWEILIQLPQTHLPTLLVGGATIALMIVLERSFKRIPAALLAMIFGIVVTSFFNLEARGVEVVGDIQGGLALLRIPDVTLADVLVLLPGAFGIALISFAEAIGPAQTYARKYDYKIDADQELIGLGAANLGAGLFQGFSVGSSLSKSAANDAVGAQTQMSGLIAAGITVLVALFLTPLFRGIPEATLGAIVVVAISGMMRVREMRRLFNIWQLDFMLALAALVGVLVFDVLPGLLIAVALSFLVLVYRASWPNLNVLGHMPDSEELVDMNRNPQSRPIPGLLIVRLNEGLFFANAAPLRDGILSLAGACDPPPRAVLLDLEMSSELDVPGADALAELHEELEQRGTRLLLSRVHPQVRETLDRSGVTVRIGDDHIYRRSFTAAMDFAAAPDDRFAPEKE